MKKSYSKNLKTVFVLSIIIASLGSCNKDKVTIDTDQQAAQDNAQAEYVFSDVNNIVDDAARSQGGVNKMAGNNFGCANITRDSSTAATNYFPKTLTCIWDSTCTPASTTENKRKGKMIIKFSAPFSQTGAVITTTFEKFSVNGYLVEGTRTLTNDGPNAVKNQSYTINIDGKITSSLGKVVTIVNANTKEITDTKGTPDSKDDTYQITGNSSGSSATGGFKAIIKTPLIVDRSSCKYITKGTVELTPAGGKAVRYIDFGDGTCDNKITVKIANTTYNLLLP